MDKEEVANPLVQNGLKLIPNVTRVFNKKQTMYVYFQAYEQEASMTQPLIAFVSFYHGQTKAFETQPVEVANGLNNQRRTMPLSFSVALDQLTPDKYDCQVTY